MCVGESTRGERRTGGERERAVVPMCVGVYGTARFRVRYTAGGCERIVKPRLRIYDIELEVRRIGLEVGG